MRHESINPTTLTPPRGYSQVIVVKSGKQVYVSGQIAMTPDGAVVGKGDLAAQTEQVYVHLGAALAAAGASLADVFKIVTYVVDLDPAKVATIRAARARFIGDGPYPASTMIGVAALIHPELLIEIEAIAAID